MWLRRQRFACTNRLGSAVDATGIRAEAGARSAVPHSLCSVPGPEARAFARHKQFSGLFVSGLSPSPACGWLPLDLRKANAAQRSLQPAVACHFDACRGVCRGGGGPGRCAQVKGEWADRREEQEDTEHIAPAHRCPRANRRTGGCPEASCDLTGSSHEPVQAQAQYMSRSGRKSRKIVVAISSMDLWVDESQAMPSRRIMASAAATSCRQFIKLE
ncbi:MAG: hypothetical protein RJA98_975 [Pseudomonadota bacterium]